MKKRIILMLMSLLISHSVVAADDPCNFANGLGFMPEQVMACYHSVPFDAARAGQMAHSLAVIEELSGLANTYKNTDLPVNIHANMPQMIREMKVKKYTDDYAFHEDLKLMFKRFHNAHWNYIMPLAYHHLTPYMPLILGSTLENGHQIVYVKGNYIAPKLYQNVSGIDTSNYIGQRIVSIDGVDAVQYLTKFANRNVAYFSYPSNNFAEIIQRQQFSLPGISRDPMPQNLSPTFVFQNKQGERSKVKLPFIFVPKEKLYGGISPVYADLSTNTSEFIKDATAPWQATDYFVQNGLLTLDGEFTDAMTLQRLGDEELMARNKMQAYWKHKALERKSALPEDVVYHDIQPTAEDLSFSVIEDNLNEEDVMYGKLGDDITVIKVTGFTPLHFDKFIETLNHAMQHACDNSSKIILDFSRNGGGAVHLTQYLIGLIDSEQSDANTFVHRFLQPDESKRPILAGFLRAGDLMSPPYTPAPLCMTGIEPGCYHRLTGSRLEHWQDAQNGTVEVRGGVKTDMTAKMYMSGLETNDFHSIPQYCNGKFGKKDIIMITDGTACSGGFFAQAFLLDKATSVAYNGLVNRKMNVGHAHGGPVHHYNMFAYDDLLYHGIDSAYPGIIPDEVFNLMASMTLPEVTPVRSDFRFEFHGGFYDKNDKNKLTAVKEYVPQYRVPIWDDSNKSVFYSAIMRAVH